MKILKVPAYIYQNGVQKEPCQVTFLQDNSIVEKYMSYTSETVLQRWEDLTDNSISQKVNSYLGFNLMNNLYPMYIGMEQNEVLGDWENDFIEFANLDVKLITGLTRVDHLQGFPNTSVKLLNNCESAQGTGCGYRQIDDEGPVVLRDYIYSALPQSYNALVDGVYNYAEISITIWPEDIFNSDGSYNYDKTPVEFTITAGFNRSGANFDSVRSITLSVQYHNTDNSNLVNRWSPAFNLANSQASSNDMENPFPEDDEPNGGDGTYGDPNSVDPTPVPDLPNISTTTFVTIYNPTSSDLDSLASFLWSDLFDVDTFKKIYGNPMDTIISLAVLPCVPASMGTKHIKFGNVDSEVTSSYCDTQFAKVECGGLNIKKIVGGFTDYTPYVKISLFLPYIGFVHLDTDDIMGGTISVTYHVDCISGDLVAFVSHNTKGVLYSYNGNCLCNIPITQGNYAGALKNYYQQIAGIIPNTVQGAASGGAAGAAMGAFSSAFNAGVNISMNTKPTYQRSGSMSGAAGIMGVQRPFIIIERPNISVPKNLGHYAGQMCNKTMALSACKGLTICEAVHLDGISQATGDELREIETLLKNGVIL